MNIANGVLIDVRDAPTIMFGNTITGNIMTEQEQYVNSKIAELGGVLLEEKRSITFKDVERIINEVIADKGEACEKAWEEMSFSYQLDYDKEMSDTIRNAVPQTKEVNN